LSWSFVRVSEVIVEARRLGSAEDAICPIRPAMAGRALMLVLQGVVAAMRDGAPASVPGAVYLDDDGLIAAVTPLDANRGGLPVRLGWWLVG
jgi:hypothetical protein